MGLINLILDVAGVLLWFYWTTMARARAAGSVTVSLLSTLKRAESARPARGSPLLVLVALLLFRSLAYWHLGSAVNWTAPLNLGAVTLSFRSDFFDRMLCFSLASFLLTLGQAYVWLVLLSALRGKGTENDPLFKWVRLQLGWIDRWPLAVKLILPLLAGGVCWYAAHPLFAVLDLVPHPLSPRHLLEQALVMGLATYLSWQFLILGLLVLYLINSHVYLGNHSLWTSVNLAARNLLRPLSWLPLRLGQLDLAAIVVIVAVFLLAKVGDRGLPWIYQRLPI